MHDPRPYLTIIAWPVGYGRDDLAAMLSHASSLDEATVRMRLGQEPPMILGPLDAGEASVAVAALERAGGDGFSFTLDDLAALGPTLKMKDLCLEAGRIVMEIWRGPMITIEREDVQILVRGHLRHETRSERPPAARDALPHLGLMGGIGSAMGIAATFESAYVNSFNPAGRKLRTSDKLDVHARDGRIFQIDGDKFAYGVLGDLRGHADRHNMDQMCELLSHLAPDEIVDPYYPLWSPPPGYERLRIPMMAIDQDDLAFAFYSRWAALMYRSLV